MSDKEVLIALAERCEHTADPDRELDAEIAVAVDGGEIVWLTANGTMEAYPARKHPSANHVGGFGKAPVPTYTASLDAAMTLVPEGASWLASRGMDEDRTGFASITVANDDPAIEPEDFDAFAATPALALTAACLRALATRLEAVLAEKVL